MRMHSDAIDYKTRIAALSSGMGRFSWSPGANGTFKAIL